MDTEELMYDLPETLIAQHPPEKRSDARLLVLDRSTGTLHDHVFSDIVTFLRPGDCLVINDTKVRPARFLGRRRTGAGLEGLFLSADAGGTWTVLLKGIRKIQPGEEIVLLDREGQEALTAMIVERRSEGECLLGVHTDQDVETTLNQIGFPPLPPYISRNHDLEQAQKDGVRYQTIYAEQAGAIAAPTAGLHFTQNLLDRLTGKGVVTARVTLHVGVGTFKPISAKRVEDHTIHSERIIIQRQAVETINQTRRQGGRVFAVGTTTVRSLESAAVGCGADAELSPFDGPTRLFIMPGYRFKLVDSLITNFHLPRSSLLALVGAFADLATIKAAYQHAIEQEYRFFSYGDAMLIL